MNEIKKNKIIADLLSDIQNDLKELNKVLIPRCECGNELIEEDGLFYCNECSKEYFRCRNCAEIVPSEELGESELAQNDMICENCMEEGYGR